MPKELYVKNRKNLHSGSFYSFFHDREPKLVYKSLKARWNCKLKQPLKSGFLCRDGINGLFIFGSF